MSDTDAAEANRRAEWLHKHKAPKDWIVLTTSEVSTIREELAAVERERDDARDWLGSYKESVEIAAREINNLKSENAKLRDIAEWAVDNIFHKCTEDLIRAELEELKQLK